MLCSVITQSILRNTEAHIPTILKPITKKEMEKKKNEERQYYAETLTFYGFWLFLYLRNIFYCLESAHSFKTNFFP